MTLNSKMININACKKCGCEGELTIRLSIEICVKCESAYDPCDNQSLWVYFSSTSNIGRATELAIKHWNKEEL